MVPLWSASFRELLHVYTGEQLADAHGTAGMCDERLDMRASSSCAARHADLPACRRAGIDQGSAASMPAMPKSMGQPGPGDRPASAGHVPMTPSSRRAALQTAPSSALMLTHLLRIFFALYRPCPVL